MVYLIPARLNKISCSGQIENFVIRGRWIRRSRIGASCITLLPWRNSTKSVHTTAIIGLCVVVSATIKPIARCAARVEM
jgi:hypothetical protein